MKNRTCYLFVFEGYADQEPALATAALEQYTDCAVYTFSTDGQSIRNMSNIHIQVDRAMIDIDIDKIDLLILPGGEAWENGGNREVLPFAKKVLDNNRTVAAICGATIGLAAAGLLDKRMHTSNGAGYLEKFVPAYQGSRHYEQKPAVTDGNIITANGAGIIDFMLEILRKDQFLDNDTIDKVSRLYKSGGLDNPFTEETMQTAEQLP